MRPAPSFAAALLLAVLTLPSAPAVVTTPTWTGVFSYDWTVGSVSGRCTDEFIAFTAQQVNSRLAVAIESGTRDEPKRIIYAGTGNPLGVLPDASCPLQIVAAPGAYENPCALLAGQATAPATTLSDPYFYHPSWNTDGTVWAKTLTFSDGGSVSYYLTSDFRGFWGSCTSPGASATFRYFTRHTLPCIAC